MNEYLPIIVPITIAFLVQLLLGRFADVYGNKKIRRILLIGVGVFALFSFLATVMPILPYPDIAHGSIFGFPDGFYGLLCSGFALIGSLLGLGGERIAKFISAKLRKR